MAILVSASLGDKSLSMYGLPTPTHLRLEEGLPSHRSRGQGQNVKLDLLFKMDKWHLFF